MDCPEPTPAPTPINPNAFKVRASPDDELITEYTVVLPIRPIPTPASPDA
jgi:hypothetical protein